MADNNQPIEWYLARDGQQHGPVSDIELKKIIELGYLQPTDLVWREGMPEWAIAESVLDLSRPMPRPEPVTVDANRRSPPDPRGEAQRARISHGHPGGSPVAHGGSGPGAPQQRAGQPGGAHVQGHHGSPAAPTHPGYGQQPGGPDGARGSAPAPVRPVRETQLPPAEPDETYAEPDRRGFPWRTAAVLVVLAGLAAGGLGLYRSGALSELPFLAAPVTSDSVPVVNRPAEASREAGGATTASIPSVVSSGSPVDESLQRSSLWKLLKRDFPEWYNERVTEIAKLSSESRSEREINAAMIRAVVELRRRHHADALAASPARLKSMAAAFVENLAQLSRVSTTACYGYISQGEASPAVADLKSAEQRAAIDAQLATIFDAVADGRKSPSPRDPPRREDYDVLSGELGKRGWSAADLQLFTDARALSRAAPEKVCQMVQDWFAAQLAVEDESAKIRLLGEALKPVVAG